MLRGGIRWSLKIGLVVTAYVTMCQVNLSALRIMSTSQFYDNYEWNKIAICLTLTFQTAHTIRNSINPVDHMAAGFILGAVFRTMGGPKAMLGKITH